MQELYFEREDDEAFCRMLEKVYTYIKADIEFLGQASLRYYLKYYKMYETHSRN
jgi:hypothetical protein